MRHFGWAYLMAHSDERVVLLNGYGDVTLEQPLMGTGPSVVEFFSDGEYRQACIVRSDFVYFNKVPS